MPAAITNFGRPAAKSLAARMRRKPAFPLTCSSMPGMAESPATILSFWLALKVTTRRAGMFTWTPVFGARPGRGTLSRSWKLPKSVSLTYSPRARAPLASFYGNSTEPSAASTGSFLATVLIAASASLMRWIGVSDFQPKALRRKRGANCHLYVVAIVRIFFCNVFVAGIAGRSAADRHSRIFEAKLLIV